jgi:hypothetical protein
MRFEMRLTSCKLLIFDGMNRSSTVASSSSSQLVYGSLEESSDDGGF